MLIIIISFHASDAQQHKQTTNDRTIDTTSFIDSSHNWYDIYDDDKVLTPSPNQLRYKIDQLVEIADNILLYQKLNGGWPKNYDMLAMLTKERTDSLKNVKDIMNTTFDNGATHSQIEYLANAYAATKIERFKDGCSRGINFILAAQ
jgi:hypothetical protein